MDAPHYGIRVIDPCNYSAVITAVITVITATDSQLHVIRQLRHPWAQPRTVSPHPTFSSCTRHLSPGTTVRQQGTTDVRQMYDSYDSYDSTTVRHLRQLYDSDHVCELSYPPTTATTATTGLRQLYDSYDSSPPGVAQFD